MSTARSGWFGVLIVIVAAAMFGSLGVLSRYAYDAGMDPFAFVSWRFVVAAVAVWVVAVVFRSPLRLRAGFTALGPMGRRWLLIAIVIGTATNLAIFLAFDNTTVALALLGFYTYPAMVAVASGLLGRESLSPTRAAAVVLALAGMAAVVLGGSGGSAGGGVNMLGVALALSAAVCQTGFILVSRGYAALPTEQAMGTILAGSGVIATVLALAISGAAALAFPLQRPDVLGVLLVVGIFPAGIASVLFLTGIRWIGPVRTGILMLFEPVVGVVLAAIFLAEGLTGLQVLGGLTILVAAIAVQRSEPVAPAAVPAIVAPGGP